MWKNVLAVIIGILVGMIVISIVEAIGHMIYPLPEGFDPYNSEIVKAYMTDMPVGALLFVLLAWAAGSYSGGWIAVLIAVRSFRIIAVIVGLFLLAAGVYNMIMIPHPLWFSVLGIMGIFAGTWLGMALGIRKA